MIKFFKKALWVIFGLVSIAGIYFLILIGLKKRKDVSTYKDKLKKKINDIDQQELSKIKEIESKANQNSIIIDKTLNISNKKKRLSKLADLVNKRE